MKLFFVSIVFALSAPLQAQMGISIGSDSVVHLSLRTSLVQEYYVERSYDLATWNRQGQIVPGNGGVISWEDNPGIVSRAFYRAGSGPLVAQRLYGLNFSPYLDGQNPNLRTPIPQAQIEARMRLLIPYSDWIRTFSMVDGLQVSGRVAHRLGFKAALGAWLGPEGTAAGLQANKVNIANLITAGQAGEADVLIVGSEVLQRGDLSSATLVAYINQVRQAVPGIPVTTADTYDALILPNKASVLAACDILMVNFYPYWKGTSITDALTVVQEEYLNMLLVGNGKAVWVSETGWPTAGNDRATAANSADYFQRFVSWARAGNVPFFYFEAFDEAWKTGEGAVGPNWGLWSSGGVLKTGAQPIFDNQFYPVDWNSLINGAGTPSIAFTSVPSLGSDGTMVVGTASHVAPFDVFVALYIKVGTQWYEKPHDYDRLTGVGRSGGWTNTFVTGGNDINASQFAAYLFPTNYLPPHVSNLSDLPTELASHALVFTNYFRP